MMLTVRTRNWTAGQMRPAQQAASPDLGFTHMYMFNQV